MFKVQSKKIAYITNARVKGKIICVLAEKMKETWLSRKQRGRKNAVGAVF